MAQPAPAPRRPCPTKCPAMPPITAPFTHPAASDGPDDKPTAASIAAAATSIDFITISFLDRALAGRGTHHVSECTGLFVLGTCNRRAWGGSESAHNRLQPGMSARYFPRFSSSLLQTQMR